MKELKDLAATEDASTDGLKAKTGELQKVVEPAVMAMYEAAQEAAQEAAAAGRMPQLTRKARRGAASPTARTSSTPKAKRRTSGPA